MKERVKRRKSKEFRKSDDANSRAPSAALQHNSSTPFGNLFIEDLASVSCYSRSFF